MGIWLHPPDICKASFPLLLRDSHLFFFLERQSYAQFHKCNNYRLQIWAQLFKASLALTRKSGVLGSIPGLATYFRSPSAFSRRAFVSYWRKCVHEVLLNRLGGLSLPRNSVVRLTDRPDMTLDVYRGRKTTTQQQQQLNELVKRSTR